MVAAPRCVRVVAAIPAVALVAGAAAGLLLTAPSPLVAHLLLSTGVTGALFAWVLRRPTWLAVSVALGFFAGAMLVASVEWLRAWRPPLRVACEGLAREARAGEGGQLASYLTRLRIGKKRPDKKRVS